MPTKASNDPVISVMFYLDGADTLPVIHLTKLSKSVFMNSDC